MSFESAFYNKYAYLTNHSARELLKALLSLYNHAKHISLVAEQINQGNEDRSKTYELICTIQTEFLLKREMLCNANELICQSLKERKKCIDIAYESIAKLPGVNSNSLLFIKRKQYHYEQIIQEHNIILDKQDAWMTSTIETMNKTKEALKK